MDFEEVVDSSPAELVVETGGVRATYQLVREVVAAHGAERQQVALRPATEGPASELTPTGESGGSEVASIGPVYRQVPGGQLAVPTGRALVRFAPGDAAHQHRDELAEAGYELDQVLSYAPHAAWVRARSGAIVDALRHLGRLEDVPGVEHVEPQLVSQVSLRS